MLQHPCCKMTQNGQYLRQGMALFVFLYHIVCGIMPFIYGINFKHFASKLLKLGQKEILCVKLQHMPTDRPNARSNK